MSILIEYESIAIDPVQAGHNHAWKIMNDGRVFVRRNPSDAVRPVSAGVFWFVDEYATQEKFTLSSKQHEKLVLYLEQFSTWPEYTIKEESEQTEHGGWDKLTVYFSSNRKQIQFGFY